jgi:hypothetical protein
MRRVEVILAAAMALSLSGCVLRGKPRIANTAPAPPQPVIQPTLTPPSEPLSVPQTQVDLPQPQPLTAEAVASTQPLEETPIAAAPHIPKPPKTKPSPAAGAQRTEPASPSPAPGPPPPQPQPADERPPIQVIVPAAELNRLRADAINSRHEIVQMLDQIRKRHLSRQDQDKKEQVQSFVTLCDQALKKGDVSQANAAAVRGLELAKQLVDGR